MRKYIFIATGGLLGALCRFLVKGLGMQIQSIIPFATLFVNISGSFILGLFLTLAFEYWELDADYRLGIATGFLGAFTTFSTLCKESVQLLDQHRFLLFAAYPVLSLLLGFAAMSAGVALARKLMLCGDGDDNSARKEA